MSKKQKPTDIGTNVTGTGTAPVQSQRTAQGAQQGGQGPGALHAIGVGDFEARHAGIQLDYLRDAEPVGTMPPPTTLKGAAKTVVDALQGKKTNVLLDKIGERLAFERTGVRLYGLLLVKHELQGSWAGGPDRHELEGFRAEELAHYHLLVAAMRQLGADPTAVTPCADIVGVESLGLHQVLADPRTTLAQGLHAIHVAELADLDGWELLVELATAMNKNDLASKFRAAAAEESHHLTRVREWVRAHQLSEAGATAKA